MARKAPTNTKAIKALRRIALAYPEAEEGTVCSKAAFKARKKSFLFVGADDFTYDVKLKLADSLDEATSLAAREPGHYSVGGHGWVEVTFGHKESPPPGLMERWIDESFRLLAPKKLVAMLPEHDPPTASPKKPTKRKATGEC